MYVCLCHGITDKDVEQAVAQGVTRMSDLKRQLKVSTQCGSCAMQVAATLRKSLENSETPFYSAA